MTRKEGIIKEWQISHPNTNDLVQLDKLCEFEYGNYCELCEFCHEIPLPINEWLNQTIKNK